MIDSKMALLDLWMIHRNRVKEYIVWWTFDREVDWFVLEDGKDVTMAPDRAGILCSREFSGLWLDVTQLLAGNMQMVLKTLQEGMQSAIKQG